MSIFKSAKFDCDQIKKKVLSGIEIFNFFVSDHLDVKVLMSFAGEHIFCCI